MAKVHTGSNIFMYVQGCSFPKKPGRTSKHPGWFPVSSANIGSTADNPRGVTGRATREPVEAAVNVIRPSDAGTALLARLVIDGRVVPKIEFEYYKRIGPNLIRARHIVLTGCLITAWEEHPGMAGKKGYVSFSVTYERIVTHVFGP